MILGFASIKSDQGLGATCSIGFGVTTLAAGFSIAATRDTRVDVLDALIPFVGGVGFLGMALADDPGTTPRLVIRTTEVLPTGRPGGLMGRWLINSSSRA